MGEIRLPPEFPSELVYEAFNGVKTERWVRNKLKKLGGVSIQGRPLMFNPEVLRENFPRVYRRCCEIITERAVNAQIEEKIPEKKPNW